MIRYIPVVRALADCDASDFADAVKEIAVISIFSFMPIWLGIIIAAVTKQDGAAELFLANFLQSGEALLISAALVGPLIYTINKRYGDLPKTLNLYFPDGWLYVGLVAIICAIAAAIFGVQRTLSISTNTDATLPPIIAESSMATLSLSILAISAFILFAASTLKNFLERGAPRIMRGDTQDFLDKWEH